MEYSLQVFLFIFIIICVLAFILTSIGDLGMAIIRLISPPSRDNEYRDIIYQTIAPLWEVNHVWLVALVVVLFVNFSEGFAIISTLYNFPLMLLVIGLILRGAGFVFSYYGSNCPKYQKLNDIIHGLGSIMAVFFFGVFLHAWWGGYNTHTYNWYSLFPLINGIKMIALSLMLAGFYLYDQFQNRDICDHLRLITLASSFIFNCCLAFNGISLFLGDLVLTPSLWQIGGNIISIIMMSIAIILSILVFLGLLIFNNASSMKYGKYATIIQLILAISGWGILIFPDIIPNIMPISAGAKSATIFYTAPVLFIGALFLIPSIIYLYILLRPAKREY